MPFPIQPHGSEPESDFLIQDPFGLRKAITPFFVFDLSDGMLANPVNGAAEGLGTSFFITPWGNQLSAMHVTTDFLNARRASIRPGPEKNLLQLEGSWIGVYHDPGLVYGAAKSGEILLANDVALFPVDQTNHPLAFTFDRDRLNYVEPSLDLTSWNIVGLKNQQTVYLPMRVACAASIKEGDRVLAVGYPSVRTFRRKPHAPMISYQEEMRGAIGRVVKLDKTWDQSKKVWPTITVDVGWKGGMSGGPVFNEKGEVVGIVSRGADAVDGSLAWSTALWLEALPYSESIYGPLDPRNPGWIVGWGACNATSAVDLFQTRKEAEDFSARIGGGLTVQKISMRHPLHYSTEASALPLAPESNLKCDSRHCCDVEL